MKLNNNGYNIRINPTDTMLPDTWSVRGKNTPRCINKFKKQYQQQAKSTTDSAHGTESVKFAPRNRISEIR